MACVVTVTLCLSRYVSTAYVFTITTAYVDTITHRQEVAAHHRHRAPLPREHARSVRAELGILVFENRCSHALLPSNLHLEFKGCPSAGRRLTENLAVAGPNDERARRRTQADCGAIFRAKPAPINSDERIFAATDRELLRIQRIDARNFRRIVLEQRGAAEEAAVWRMRATAGAQLGRDSHGHCNAPHAGPRRRTCHSGIRYPSGFIVALCGSYRDVSRHFVDAAKGPSHQSDTPSGHACRRNRRRNHGRH